jgi:CHAT domain-containing protein
MRYQDMVVEAASATLERTPDKQRIGRFTVRVLSSPAGEMKPEEAVAVTYDDKQLQLTLQQLDNRSLDRAGLVALGRLLALLLLPPAQAAAATGVRELLADSLNQVGPDDGLRLRLRLPPQLAALPWEYMYVERAGGGEGLDGFLALDPRVAIVRHEALSAPDSLPLTSGPIKVVAALASAEGLPPLDLAKEQADLTQALGSQAGVEPVFLADATLDEIQAAIQGAEIFHFAGHGTFKRQMGDMPGTYTGTGALALYDQEVDAEQLGINLRGNGVRVAVLGGCETGRRDGVNVWSGVAPALVKQQIPAVIANQFPIKDVCAIAFSKQFYGALVGGLPLERAVAAGRIAAFNADEQGRDWGVPVLYLRDADGQLFGGAADAGVREKAVEAAKAVIDVRVQTVAAGGKVLGAKVGQLTKGSLDVTVVVGTAAGDVTGATIDAMIGGEANVKTSVDSVADGGNITGATINL